jgi:uncharacterized membrane protein YfhO
MKQQTAVEWLEQQLFNKLGKFTKGDIEQAKEMEKQQIIDASKINRVEVIQHSEPYNGRAYTNYNAKDVEIQVQDNNETLKIFLR